jgi:hypothetical protein
MSTIIVASIILFGVIGITIIFVYMHNQHLKKKRQVLLFCLNKLAAQHGLSFTSQEVLLNKAIGLHGLQRKLLIVEENNAQYDWNVIDLEEVENCLVKKVYDRIDAGGLKTKRVEEYLRTIVLQFNFNNNNPSFDFILYENTVNSIYEMPALENKARKWQAMFSKMIMVQAKERA